MTRRLVRIGQLLNGFPLSGLCLVLPFGNLPSDELAGAWLGPALTGTTFCRAGPGCWLSYVWGCR